MLLGIHQLTVKPAFLLKPQQGAIVTIALSQRVSLSITAGQTGIQHAEVHQIPKPETAVNTHIAAIRLTNRHPFQIRSHRAIEPLTPVARVGIAVLFGTADPGVVRHLMVIPDHHKGMLTMNLL